MNFELNALYQSFVKAAVCLPVTIILAVVPFTAGLLLGVPVAVIRRFGSPWSARFLAGLVTCFKGVPPVLLVLLTNYLVLKPIDLLAVSYEWLRPLQTMNKIYIGIIALSLFAATMLSETIRSALLAVDNGQYEAGVSVGLTKKQTLLRIVLPQAFALALPVLCGNLIGLIKTSLIVYLISVNDILNGAKNAAANNFRYLEAYVAAAFIYWGLCALVERGAAWLEQYHKNKSEVRI